MTDTEFQQIWNTSQSRSEVAARVGKDAHSCTSRAKRQRKAGMRMKSFGGEIMKEKKVSAPNVPTDAYPGSREKIAALIERYENGQSLWHPDDATYGTATDGSPRGMAFPAVLSRPSVKEPVKASLFFLID